MFILEIAAAILFICWAAIAGFGLLVNIFTGPGQAGFWGAMFHRCTWKDVLILWPGLIWVLPLAGAAWLARKARVR